MFHCTQKVRLQDFKLLFFFNKKLKKKKKKSENDVWWWAISHKKCHLTKFSRGNIDFRQLLNDDNNFIGPQKHEKILLHTCFKTREAIIIILIVDRKLFLYHILHNITLG